LRRSAELTFFEIFDISKRHKHSHLKTTKLIMSKSSALEMGSIPSVLFGHSFLVEKRNALLIPLP
jgi:hypothetical protein